MKLRFVRTPKKDALIGIVVALLLGFIFSSALGTQEKTVEQKSVPFETHPNMLLVRTTLHRERPPTIDRVEKLESGRVSVTAPGANTLQLLDASGNVLYCQSFDVRFARTTDPPEILDSLSLLFVVPYGDQVKRVRVTTPNGSADFLLE